MSELVVKSVKIDQIKKHPNADKLEIAVVGGWEVVTGKGNHSVGDTVVHVQPDSMIPRDQAQAWGVEQYLAFKKNEDMGRVRAARLRGYTSYGFLAPNDTNAPPGTDLAEHYGIHKYEPPPPPVGMSAGQMRKQHPFFHMYTDIQNLRNHPDKLNYNEPLVVLEKLHGTNSRVGWVRRINKGEHQQYDEFERVVGTHRTQRDPEDCGVYGLPWEQYGDALEKTFKWILEAYCDPDHEAVPQKQVDSVIFFGEIIGRGVQDLHYGFTEEKGYRVFDIAVNGTYLPWGTLGFYHDQFGLPLVPELAHGVYYFEDLIEISQGYSTFDDKQIREGIVVKPIMEQHWKKGSEDPNPKRMIFKLINPDYLTRKNGTEYH